MAAWLLDPYSTAGSSLQGFSRALCSRRGWVAPLHPDARRALLHPPKSQSFESSTILIHGEQNVSK